MNRESPPVKGLRPSVILLLGALTAIGPLAIDMYLPAFPAIADGLGVDLGAVQLTLSVFFAGIAIGQIVYGPITDRWGRRAPLLVGTVCFMIAAIGCASARSLDAMLFWRAAMSVGGAAGMVISKAVVRDRCDTSQMAKMFSILMLIMGVAPILAPTLGGALLGWVGWRGIFGFIAFFGASCSLWAYFHLEETLPHEKRRRGGIAPALRTYWRLSKNPWFLAHTLIAASISGALFGYVSAAPTILTERHALTPGIFSVVFGINAACLIAAAQLNSWLLRHWSPRQLLVVGSLTLATAAGVLVAATTTNRDSLILTEVCLALILGSAGLSFPNVGALALSPFGEVAGSASALQGGLQFGVGALAGAANGFFYTGGVVPPALIMAAFATVAALAGWMTRRWPIEGEVEIAS